MINADRDTLLGMLACPRCGEALTWGTDGLACSVGHTYAVRDGAPELYPEAGSGDHDRARGLAALKHFLVARPHVYNAVQAWFGGGDMALPVVRELERATGETVLDIGAGTGGLALNLPRSARYVWLDNDQLKLRGLLSRDVECMAVLGDASRLPFRDASVDVVATIDVSHHLPDEALARFLDEAARVARGSFVFVDAVKTSRVTSRLLWAGDVGRHPRYERDLFAAVEAAFVVEHVERFRLHHDYILCRCRPRRTAEAAPTA